jgi:hypothetical protein
MEQSIERPPPSPGHKENEYLGHRLTPEGRFEYRWRGGQEVRVDPLEALNDDDLPLPHRGFKEKHRQAFNQIFWAVEQLLEQKRQIPVLREELERIGVTKRLVKDLEDFGLVEQQVVHLTKLGGRAAVVPSLEGRRLMRFFENALNGKMLDEEVDKTVESGET